MPNVYTNLKGFAKIRGPGKVRNAHLIPEVTLRSKRILQQAQEEEERALDYYPNSIEYYKLLINGRRCTCKEEKIEFDQEKQKDAGASLDDFLFQHNLSLPDKDYCPLCFGNTYVGGYYKLGSSLIVLDATLTNRPYRTNLIKEKPYYFKPNNKWGYIKWRVSLPKYYDDITDVAIKWKEEPNEWEFLLNDEPVTKDLLLASKGQSVDFKVRMKDSINDNAGFYGVFIYFKISRVAIQADMPRHTVSYVGELNVIDETQNIITINFDKSIREVNTTDLVVDQNGLLYRIIECEKINPMAINIASSCQARLVRAFEKYFLLPNKILYSTYNIKELYTFII